jgi:hypothetical protein
VFVVGPHAHLSHRPSSLSLTTTTTSLPRPSNQPTSLHFTLSFTVITYSAPQHTLNTPAIKPSSRYNRLASPSPGSPCLKVRRARFRLPSPVHQRRHPPTSHDCPPPPLSVKITTTPTPPSPTLIGLSPIVPCDRLPCICTRAATSQSPSPVPRSCANIPQTSQLYPHAT